MYFTLFVHFIARVQILAVAEYFKGLFPRLITLCQPVLSQRGKKVAQSPSMTPHNLWTARRKAKVQPWTDNG